MEGLDYFEVAARDSLFVSGDLRTLTFDFGPRNTESVFKTLDLLNGAQLCLERQMPYYP